MENNYTLILKELKKHGPEVKVDINSFLLSILEKPTDNSEYNWNKQRKESFDVLYALKKNTHIDFDESQTLDRIKYNYREQNNQEWLDGLQSFDAKILPLGISFLQELSIDNINDSIIKTNESVVKTNESFVKTNEAALENTIFHKRLTIASILTALVAVILSGMTYFKDDSKELRQTNILLQQQVKILQNMLQVQKESYSFQSTTVKDSLKKK